MSEGLPQPFENPDSALYWEGARNDRLMIRSCRACGEKHFMPRFLCPHCWSTELDWVQASGRGTVHSFSIIRRAPSAAFAPGVPYVVALVDLEEGPRMMSNIVGDGALEVRIGDPVQVRFERRGDSAKIPQFARQA